ncbi:protein kinase [bacterium]|nr:protein kinase [bacterium]
MDFPGYQVISEIGRGGMGVVLRARAASGREVAIKLLLHQQTADASDRALARFERERRLLSSLAENEGFVPLLDAGESPRGPYLVMPFVGGGTLRNRILEGRLPVSEVVSLGRELARALGRAHERGIVHRDLKPENVLFMEDGRPLIADLGLAKHFSREGLEGSKSISFSRSGEFMGSAGYMPIEQMNDAKAVGPAADVFALGAILHECLSGKPAFDGDSIHSVMAKVSTGERTPLRSLRHEVPRWLSSVIDLALARDVKDRLPDGNALARALEGEGAPRRSRGPALALGALAAAAAALATAGFLFLSRRDADRPPDVARNELKRTSPDVPRPPPPVPAPAPTFPLPCHGFLRSKRARLQQALGDYCGKSWNPCRSVCFLEDGKRAFTGAADRTIKLWDLATGIETLTLYHERSWVEQAAVSPDGKRGLSAGGGTIKLWDLEKGRELLTLPGHGGKAITGVAFLPADTALSTGEDGAIKVWDLSRGSELVTIAAHETAIRALAVARDGSLAITSAGDETPVRIWDLRTRKPAAMSHLPPTGDPPVVSLDVSDPSDDGMLVLCGSWHEARLYAFSSSPLSAAKEGEKGRVRRIVLQGGEGWTTSVALSRDVKRAVLGSQEGSVRVFDGATGKLDWTLDAHTRPVSAVAISPDSSRALSASPDGLLRLWDLESGKPLWPHEGHAGWVYSVALSADGKTAVSGGIDRIVRAWDLARGKLARALPPHGTRMEDFVQAVAVSPDGKRALSGGRDNVAREWDLATGEETATLGLHESKPEQENLLASVAFSPSGREALTASTDGTLILWDLALRLDVRRLRGHGGTVASVVFSPDGKRALSGSADKTAKLWDLATGQVVATLPHPGGVPCVRFLSSGKRALTASDDGSCRVWDLATGECVRSFSGHTDQIYSIAATPDSKLALSASLDQTIRFWDLATGAEVDRLDLTSATDFAVSLAMAPDGRSFIAGTGRGLVLRFSLDD